MRLALPRWGYLAIVGSLVVAVLGRVATQRMARPKPWFTYSMSPLSQADYGALAARPGWEKSSLRMADGVSLAGLVSRPAQAGAPWVLFFPGNDATQLARGQQLLEQIRADNPWGLAVYASRGYDLSGGAPSAPASASDAISVFEAVVREQRVDPSQVHLVAFSLGGYGAAHVARHSAKAGKKPGSLALLASVAHVAMVHHGWLANFTMGDVYDLLPVLPEVPAPVLVVQGGADEAFGDTRQAKLLVDGLGDRARYLELPGVGHNALLASEPAISAVRASIESASKIAR
jgi:pimeloyl-ACP methyl ester carboxylesterase